MIRKYNKQNKSNLLGLLICISVVLVSGYFIYTNYTFKKASNLSCDELLSDAWQNFQLTEYNKSVKLFEQITEMTDKNDPDHLKALYGLGNVWWLRQEGKDNELASEYFNQIIKIAPESDMACWSQLALARMLHLVPVGSEVDYEKVRDAYRGVVESNPGHPASEEAFLYLQATYIINSDANEAKIALANTKEYLKKHPGAKFKSSLYSIMANCYGILKDYDKQLAAMIKAYKTTEIDPESPGTNFDNTYWGIANVAEFRAGRLDIARKFYRKLIEEYPTDMRVYTAELAIKRIDNLEKKLLAEIRIENKNERNFQQY